ncbi:hypothetical protein DW66_4821 [Pseudomonas putida]|nr:hypothetical protein DW66_4821 [Pseudomonas putida]AJG11598.1 hypothetical protein RK21_00090 [Pseudomonas plecoglossicida]
MPRRGLRPRFAGEPAPTGTAPASRAARSLWERLWPRSAGHRS